MRRRDHAGMLAPRLPELRLPESWLPESWLLELWLPESRLPELRLLESRSLVVHGRSRGGAYLDCEARRSAGRVRFGCRGVFGLPTCVVTGMTGCDDVLCGKRIRERCR